MIPHLYLWPYFLAYLVTTGLVGAILHRWLIGPRGAPTLTWTIAMVALSFVIALGFRPPHPIQSSFTLMLTWTWAGGVATPAILAWAGWASLRQHRRRGQVTIGLACVIVFITVQAVYVGPRRIEFTEVRLTAPVTSPLRLAIVADLQADRPGAFEEQVLRQTLAYQPDAIVFPGDLIQAFDDELYHHAQAELREIFEALDLDAPLGVYVTPGDAEWRGDWSTFLQGTHLHPLASPTQTIRLRDDIDLTGIDLHESGQPQTLSRPSPRAHIVVGHRPDFALGNIDADLLIAGHTHGGQVQIPGYGPLITFSNVPRAWAGGGVVSIDEDSTLIVSRGIGMERGLAPRIRLFCRPQVLIVDLVPGPTPTAERAI